MSVWIKWLVQREMTSHKLLFWFCCYLVLVFNAPFLLGVINVTVILQDYSLLFLLTLPLMLFGLSYFLLSIFIGQILQKTALILVAITSAMIFYAMVQFGVQFDNSMVQNTFETHPAEALGFVNLKSIISLCILAGIPIWFIVSTTIKDSSLLKTIYKRIAFAALSLIISVAVILLNYSSYSSVGRNNKELVNLITPFKFYDASYKYIKRHYIDTPPEFKVLDEHPQLAGSLSSKRVMVVVLGETARAANFSYSGYARDTNHHTKDLDPYFFTNVHSCGTATAVSVPCMFSSQNKSNFETTKAYYEQNVLDIMQTAGVDVSWIENDNSCKGVCNRIPSSILSTDEKNPLCDGEYCFDEALLAPLKAKLANLEADETVIVLHMIGSHGPTYYRRYPKEHTIFTPDCQTSDIHQCSQEEVVNSYDNSIRYTDYILSQVIATLEKSTEDEHVSTAMLYISDHGESLGENGLYLHGLPYSIAPETQTHVPMMLWLDPKISDYDSDCIRNQSASQLSHDNIFDSLLGIMSVNTTAYRQQQDFLATCKIGKAIVSSAEVG